MGKTPRSKKMLTHLKPKEMFHGQMKRFLHFKDLPAKDREEGFLDVPFTEILKSGTLFHQGKIVKKWKLRRIILLKNGTLQYAHVAKTAGRFDLIQSTGKYITQHENSSKGPRRCFQMQNHLTGKKIVLCGERLDEWVQLFQKFLMQSITIFTAQFTISPYHLSSPNLSSHFQIELSFKTNFFK